MTLTNEARPEVAAIDPGLFTWPSDDPRLIGSRCRDCGTVTFPQRSSCPRCTSSEVAQRLLPTRGKLWTYTIQGFRPKTPPYEGPEEFEPYAVGYVQLADEVKVESRLVDVDLDQVRIGMPLQLAIVPFESSVTGETTMSFGFRPDTARTDEEAAR